MKSISILSFLLCFSLAVAQPHRVSNCSQLIAQLRESEQERSITIDKKIHLEANCLIPRNIHLNIEKGGGFILEKGVSLTILGNLSAGIYQIFELAPNLSCVDAIKGDVLFDKAYPHWFGAKGDGTNDDTRAIQLAVDFVSNQKNSVLYFPANRKYQSYLISKTIKIRKAIDIIGAGIERTTIIAKGFDQKDVLFDYYSEVIADDTFGTYAPVVEHLKITGLTLRSLPSKSGTKVGIGIKNTNFSYFLMEEVRFYDLYIGSISTGIRTYSNTWDRVVCYGIERTGILFENFKGGGHLNLFNCTFQGGQYGFLIDSTSNISGISLYGCNFEKGNTGLFVAGTVLAMNINGCRTEGNLSTDFHFFPSKGNYITSLNIQTNYLQTNSAGSSSLVFNGSQGQILGFEVTGNYAAVAEKHLIDFHSADQIKGHVRNNFLQSLTGKISANTPPLVAFEANLNESGRLDQRK